MACSKRQKYAWTLIYLQVNAGKMHFLDKGIVHLPKNLIPPSYATSKINTYKQKWKTGWDLRSVRGIISFLFQQFLCTLQKVPANLRDALTYLLYCWYKHTF